MLVSPPPAARGERRDATSAEALTWLKQQMAIIRGESYTTLGKDVLACCAWLLSSGQDILGWVGLGGAVSESRSKTNPSCFSPAGVDLFPSSFQAWPGGRCGPPRCPSAHPLPSRRPPLPPPQTLTLSLPDGPSPATPDPDPHPSAASVPDTPSSAAPAPSTPSPATLPPSMTFNSSTTSAKSNPASPLPSETSASLTTLLTSTLSSSTLSTAAPSSSTTLGLAATTETFPVTDFVNSTSSGATSMLPVTTASAGVSDEPSPGPVAPVFYFGGVQASQSKEGGEGLLRGEDLSQDLQEGDLQHEGGYQDVPHQPKMSEVFSKPFLWLGTTEQPTTPVVPITPSSRLSTTHWYDYLLNHVTQNAAFPSGFDQSQPFLRPTVRPPLFLRPSTSPPTFDLRLQGRPPIPFAEHGPPPSEGRDPALSAGEAFHTSLDPGLASLLQWLPQGTSFQGLPYVPEVSTGFPPTSPSPQRSEVVSSAPPFPQGPPGAHTPSALFLSFTPAPRPPSAPSGPPQAATGAPPDASFYPSLSPSVVLRSQDSARLPAGDPPAAASRSEPDAGRLPQRPPGGVQAHRSLPAGRRRGGTWHGPPTPPQAVLVGGDVNTLVKAPGHFHGEKGEPVKNMFPDNYQVRFPIQVGHGAPGLQVVTPGAVAGQQVVPPAGVQANQAYFQVASPHNFQVKKPESVQIRNPGPIQIRYPPQLQVVNPSQSQVAKPGQSQVTSPNQYQVVKAGQSQVAIPSQSQVANQGGLPIRAPIRLQSSPAGSERQANGTNYPFDLDLSSLDVAYLVYPQYEQPPETTPLPPPATSPSSSNMEILYPLLGLGQNQLQNQSQSVVNEVHSYQNLVIQLANGTNITTVVVSSSSSTGDGNTGGENDGSDAGIYNGSTQGPASVGSSALSGGSGGGTAGGTASGADDGGTASGSEGGADGGTTGGISDGGAGGGSSGGGTTGGSADGTSGGSSYGGTADGTAGGSSGDGTTSGSSSGGTVGGTAGGSSGGGTTSGSNDGGTAGGSGGSLPSNPNYLPHPEIPHVTTPPHSLPSPFKHPCPAPPSNPLPPSPVYRCNERGGE
ncbi:hypothetical protein C7M84_017111 [Penaeus vannamei]|uniref:Uncharacterized protein n=1 Tax=Penaeus vannamei TaxID=6689 RepID=A0A3R7PFM5_PENVA|nr:hypothetical protein C7M84_017111 [Penaeus vannamei]